MNTLSTGIASLAALAILGLAAPAAATTAISGEVNVIANANIGIANFDANGGQLPPTILATDSHANSASWSGVPSSIAASTSALALLGSDSVFAHSSASATWTSADAGTVSLASYGWTFDVNNPANTYSEADLNNLRSGNGDWAYAFTATSNGVFTMNYTIVGSGNEFGLWGFPLNGISGSGGPVVNAFDPSGSGTFTGALVAGHSYLVSLNSFPNVATGNGNFSGAMDGRFNWSITSNGVPEPATWALMLAGFSGLGVALRRRRSALA